MKRLVRSEAGDVTELALLLPVFFFIVFAGLQLGLLVIVHYDVKHVTRETTRWLAVNPNTTDATALAHAQADVLPGMDASDITASGLTISPACASLDSNNRCTARVDGTPLTVSLVYDASSSWFFPSRLGFGLNFSLPTTMSSQVSMVVE